MIIKYVFKMHNKILYFIVNPNSFEEEELTEQVTSAVLNNY